MNQTSDFLSSVNQTLVSFLNLCFALVCLEHSGDFLTDMSKKSVHFYVCLHNCELISAPKMSHKQEKTSLEREITLAEASLALKNMKNYKSPGSIGFIADFFFKVLLVAAGFLCC